jgi:hypothetical protein
MARAVVQIAKHDDDCCCADTNSPRTLIFHADYFHSLPLGRWPGVKRSC